jgi:hypothetical protein
MRIRIFLLNVVLFSMGTSLAVPQSSRPHAKSRTHSCDGSCVAFRTVLDARPQLFRSIRGAQISENRWQAKLVVPALSSGVCVVAELPPPVQGTDRWGTYFCQLPRAARDSAIKQFQSVLVSLQAALPKEWHTELFENDDEKTPIFRAGPSSDELYLVLSCISDDRGYSLTFQASSMPIPTD